MKLKRRTQRARVISYYHTRSEASAVRSEPTHEDRMADLDLMIRNGWGSTLPEDIPEDWRTKTKDDATA